MVVEEALCGLDDGVAPARRVDGGALQELGQPRRELGVVLTGFQGADGFEQRVDPVDLAVVDQVGDELVGLGITGLVRLFEFGLDVGGNGLGLGDRFAVTRMAAE